MVSAAENVKSAAGSTQLIGKAALIASVGGQRAFADAKAQEAVKAMGNANGSALIMPDTCDVPRVHGRRRQAQPGQAEAEHRPLGDDSDGAVAGHRLRQGRGHLLLRHRPQPEPEKAALANGVSEELYDKVVNPLALTRGLSRHPYAPRSAT